jgi:hypothetical protein
LYLIGGKGEIQKRKNSKDCVCWLGMLKIRIRTLLDYLYICTYIISKTIENAIIKGINLLKYQKTALLSNIIASLY